MQKKKPFDNSDFFSTKKELKLYYTIDLIYMKIQFEKDTRNLRDIEKILTIPVTDLHYIPVLNELPVKMLFFKVELSSCFVFSKGHFCGRAA